MNDFIEVGYYPSYTYWVNNLTEEYVSNITEDKIEVDILVNEMILK